MPNCRKNCNFKICFHINKRKYFMFVGYSQSHYHFEQLNVLLETESKFKLVS